MQHQFFTPFWCGRRHPRHSSGVELPAPSIPRVSRSCSLVDVVKTSMDSVENEPYLEAPTHYLGGRLAVLGDSVVAEVKVFMDSGSGITAMSEEPVETLRGQPGITPTALTQAFVGHPRVVASLGQECDIETQSCPLQLAIEMPWAPVRFTMPFPVLPGGGDVVIMGQKTLRKKLGIDVMAQLKTSVLKACGRQDGAGMELTARAVGEPNAGAVLPAGRLSRRSGRAAMRQVTWTMTSHWRCRLNDP